MTHFLYIVMYIWVEDTKDFHLAKFITKEKIILFGVVEKGFFIS